MHTNFDKVVLGLNTLGHTELIYTVDLLAKQPPKTLAIMFGYMTPNIISKIMSDFSEELQAEIIKITMKTEYVFSDEELEEIAQPLLVDILSK